jgi:ribosomal protein S27AE
MSFQLAEERWCPKCAKLFLATVIVERRGKDEVRTETPCPDCGADGSGSWAFSATR